MAHSKESMQEAIRLAQEASQAADPALRTNAFEVVLAHLLGGEVSGGGGVPAVQRPAHAPAVKEPESGGTTFDPARIATQLGISEDQVEDLYELKDNMLFLSVKPVGATLPEQRRCLANLLLVGYRFGLALKTVPQSKLLKAAEEWNVNGDQFSRDIKASKHVQSKAGGRGSDPIVSLAPGSITNIAEEARLLLNP